MLIPNLLAYILTRLRRGAVDVYQVKFLAQKA
jgi:hypothetical protein